MPVSSYLFKRMHLLDPRWDRARDGYEVLIEGALIKEVSTAPIRAEHAVVIDCGGRTLMPGLIDCHVHAFLSEVDLRKLEAMPITLMAARGVDALRRMLDRGFTTVRDAGGADWGLKRAVEDGVIAGPRLFISGQAIGPTGGHSDMRRRSDASKEPTPWNALRYVMRIADGPDEIRYAVREQLRQGADQVKIMCSGGVASPHDPLESQQLSAEEIRTAVDEAGAFGRYVLAHAYTPDAITRAVENGVRTIEHGNLVDAASARMIASRHGFLIANLVTYSAMRDHGAHLGMTREMLAKNDMVLDAGLRSLETCQRAGVPVAYGSDLLGELQDEQSREFVIRAEVLSPLEVIRQATLVGAQVVQQEGRLGVIEPGALADLIVLDEDPLRRLEVFLDQGAHIPVVMRDGRLHRNRLL